MKKFTSIMMLLVMMLTILSSSLTEKRAEAAVVESNVPEIKYAVDYFGDGYVANISLTNPAKAEIRDWHLTIFNDTDTQVYQAFNTRYHAEDGIITFEDEFNRPIKANGRASFAFIGIGTLSDNLRYKIEYSIDGMVYSETNNVEVGGYHSSVTALVIDGQKTSVASESGFLRVFDDDVDLEVLNLDKTEVESEDNRLECKASIRFHLFGWEITISVEIEKEEELQIEVNITLKKE